MTRKLPWLLCLFSAFAALYLFALLLNAGVALDDARTQSARLRERNELMLSIARKGWIGKETTSVTDLADVLERQGVIVKRTNTGSLEIGYLFFEIEDGLVVQVRYFD